MLPYLLDADEANLGPKTGEPSLFLRFLLASPTRLIRYGRLTTLPFLGHRIHFLRVRRRLRRPRLGLHPGSDRPHIRPNRRTLSSAHPGTQVQQDRNHRRLRQQPRRDCSASRGLHLERSGGLMLLQPFIAKVSHRCWCSSLARLPLYILKYRVDPVQTLPGRATSRSKVRQKSAATCTISSVAPFFVRESPRLLHTSLLNLTTVSLSCSRKCVWCKSQPSKRGDYSTIWG